MLTRFVNLLKTTALALALCASAQSAFAQSGCLVPLDGYLGTLPVFSAPELKNVVNSLREQGALHLQSAR